MKLKFFLLIFFILAIVLLALPLAVSASSDSSDQITLIKFKTNEARDNFVKSNSNSEVSKIDRIARVEKVNFLEDKWLRVKNVFNRDIDYIETGQKVKINAIPNDTYYSSQRGLSKIKAISAWNITTGNSNQVIAIIDTGVQLDHPDLNTKIWQNEGETSGEPDVDDDDNGLVDDEQGWDWVTCESYIPNTPDCQPGHSKIEDNDPSDEHGHGTSVAGIAAANTNNSVGVAGVNWQAKIMPLRVLNQEGEGMPDDVALAINYAADFEVGVVNMSLGTPDNFSVMRDAAAYAYDHGTVLVAATGNDSAQSVDYPARYDHVIGVGSISSNGYLSTFTNTGVGLDITAPGENIYTTHLGSVYGGWGQGTSYSSPFVAGAASLILDSQPNLNADQINAKMKALGDSVAGFHNLKYLNLWKALKIKLIKTTTSHTYLVDGTKMYALWPSNVFWQRFGFSSSYVETVSLATLNNFTNKGWLKGLIRAGSSGSVYYIDYNRRYKVWPSTIFYKRWGFSSSDVLNVSSSLLSCYNNAGWLSGIVKGETSNQAYYIDRGGRKYAIWSSSVFWERWGFRYTDAVRISNAQLAYMTNAGRLNGLVRSQSNSQLYYIDNGGAKYRVPFGSSFWSNWNFNLSDVSTISNEQLAYMQNRGDLSLFARGNILSAVCKMRQGRCFSANPSTNSVSTLTQGQFDYLRRL